VFVCAIFSGSGKAVVVNPFFLEGVFHVGSWWATSLEESEPDEL
jgi:hypothetical protein